MNDIRDTYELRSVCSYYEERIVAQYLAVIHGLLGKVATKQAIAEMYQIAEQLPEGDRRNDVMSDLATICDHYGIEQGQLP
jgi:hypothetical protein